MSFWGSFSVLHCLGVLYLLVLFPFNVVLLDLLAGPPLGGCRILVMLLSVITAEVGVVGEAVVGCAAHQVSCVSGSGPGRKRIRLNRKNSSTHRGIYGSISSTCLEEVASCGAFQFLSS